ncbi:putative plant self-incompatibility S1 [Helianthus anomalus]
MLHCCLLVARDAYPIPSPIPDASLSSSPIQDASPASSPLSNSKAKFCLLTYWSVYIYNFIPGTITVHPQSADDDLGNRQLAYGNHTDWSFCLQTFLKTRFYAHFYWNSRTAFFDVYNYGLGESYCTNGKELIREQTCYWMVTHDGFYVMLKE